MLVVTMIAGCLIAESMRVGSTVDGVMLRVTKVSRADAGDVDAGQPRTWTFIEFEAEEADADRLTEALSRALASEGGWYCDLRTDAETFVVFANRVFRYPRGNASARAQAADYARSVRVPESQLDWPV